MRRGFTLVEMLVACGIFLFGFMAVYSMFLVGIRNRSLADATTRGATIASSVIAEIRLKATNEVGTVGSPSAWATPSNYVGDGDPDTNESGDSGSPGDWYVDDACFFAHPDQPGMYYRVVSATDLQGLDAPADGIVLTLLIGQLDSQLETLSLKQLQERYRLSGLGDVNGDGTTDHQDLLEHLVDRGTLQRYDTVIHRQVAWQR